jgi:hypothetical protein
MNLALDQYTNKSIMKNNLAYFFKSILFANKKDRHADHNLLLFSFINKAGIKALLMMKALFNYLFVLINFYINKCFDHSLIDKKNCLYHNFIKYIILFSKSKKTYLLYRNNHFKFFFRILNLVFSIKPNKYLITSNAVL